MFVVIVGDRWLFVQHL